MSSVAPRVGHRPGRCWLRGDRADHSTLPCRVLNKQGLDITDASGLPVDILVKQADLTPAAKAVVDACGVISA
jgi:hypothetical protein